MGCGCTGEQVFLFSPPSCLPPPSSPSSPSLLWSSPRSCYFYPVHIHTHTYTYLIYTTRGREPPGLFLILFSPTASHCIARVSTEGILLRSFRKARPVSFSCPPAASPDGCVFRTSPIFPSSLSTCYFILFSSPKTLILFLL